MCLPVAVVADNAPGRHTQKALLAGYKTYRCCMNKEFLKSRTVSYGVIER